jgi:hypothetical protein
MERYKRFFEEDVFIYHVTSPDISDSIKETGFKSTKNSVDYKYYSNLGSDGVYFYDNMRLVQSYAYFLKSKLKLDYVVLIKCKIDSKYLKSSDKIEDGLFVKNSNLSKVNIISYQNISKIGDLY